MPLISFRRSIHAFLHSNKPTRVQRIVFAVVIGVMAALYAWAGFQSGRIHSDFGMVWFGARALLQHTDPYSLVGPGRAFDYEWPLIYPATALVAAIPFTPLSERLATIVFVALSAGLLAFGITRDGWQRIPIFATVAFITSARLGQWSILFTASIFFAPLSILSCAKPQASLPILAGTTDKRALWFALIGALLLIALSFLLLPGWAASWIAAIQKTSSMEPPIMRIGGPLLLLTLFRWRRPESWLLLTLAVLPQSWGWYNTLPLFVIPKSFGESVLLAATALAGSWFADNALNPQSVDSLTRSVGAVIVFTIYLPAMILILRRSNDVEPPAWMRILTRWARVTPSSA